MPTGKIKFFNEKKGFGFISTDGSPDVFLHISNFLPEGTYPKEGQLIQFDTEIDKRTGKTVAVNASAA